jgi:hypothetical protein
MKRILLFLPITFCFSQWVPQDSVTVKIDIPAGSFLAIRFDKAAETLSVIEPPGYLITPAKLAVERAPVWLKLALADNLSKLDSIFQEQYAQMILNAQDPLIDEIVFQVAHIPYNILNHSDFYPVMIIENTSFLYQIDSVLPYARIVDYGVGGADSNYYSTVSYRVLNESGDTIEIEYDKDYYYWYIVHPKVSRELCAYIDPNTGNSAPPPTGKFWRDFLVNHADTGYPYLKDYLMDIQILWGGLHNDTTDANGAIARVNNWMRRVLAFQSPGIRKYQPVHIYREHRGTCTEWSILTAAAARASLIPIVRTSAYGNNHHWNEFYEQRWVQWEPVNRMIDDYRYDPNWWELAAAINWRGDGYTWLATERYTPHCTLTVQVSDSMQNPVDGARIAVKGGPQQVTWYCCFDYTNSLGECSFLLGDLLNYDVQITSGIGSIPFTNVITDAQAGMHYYWTPQLAGGVPLLPVLDDTFPSNPDTVYRVDINLSLPEEIIYGNSPDDNSAFAHRDTTGLLGFFVCDSANFTRFLADSQFYAFLINKQIQEIDTNFTFPWEDPAWYLVIPNKEKLLNNQEISLKVTVFKNPAGIGEMARFTNGIPSLLIYPNPFSTLTRISVGIEQSAESKGINALSTMPFAPCIKIYDASGRLVRTFSATPGNSDNSVHSVSWDGTNDVGKPVESGVYFAKFGTQSSKFLFVR